MRLLKPLLIVFVCAIGPAVAGCAAGPALTGPLEDGYLEDAYVAYKKGDYAMEFRLRRPLAEQGHADAQNALGLMYYRGHGVPQDYAAAVSWYRKAAEQGNANGQFFLGSMYAMGQGVPQDYVQAHMWFNLAAAKGDADKIKIRELTAAQMTPAQIAEAQKLAREWKPKQ